MSAKREPAPDDQFWDTIALLEGEVTEAGIERLVNTLARRGFADIWRFEDQLNQALERLTTDEFDQSAILHASDGTGIGWTGSALDVLRLGVVAAGRSRFDEIAADPSAVRGEWNLEAADDLGIVADLALDRAEAAGLDEPNPTELSPEPHAHDADTHDRDGIDAVTPSADPQSEPVLDLAVGIVMEASVPPMHYVWLGRDRTEDLVRRFVTAELARSEYRRVRERLGSRRLEIHGYYLHPDEQRFYQARTEGRTTWLRRRRDSWEVELALDATRIGPLGPYQAFGPVKELPIVGSARLPREELSRTEAARITAGVLYTLTERAPSKKPGR